MFSSMYDEDDSIRQVETPYDRAQADEVFAEREIVTQVLDLIQTDPDARVVVSTEWLRKREMQRGPLNATSPYRGSGAGDDIVFAVEVRFAALDSRIEGLKTLVEQTLEQRAADRDAEALAALEAARAKAQTEIDRLNERIAARKSH